MTQPPWVKATPERVVEVIEALSAQGAPITQRSVKDALGGGSYGTIGPILRRWKAAHVPAKGSKDLPKTVESIGRKLIEEIWTAAQQHAAQASALGRAEAAQLRERHRALEERLAATEALLAAKEAQIAAHIEARHAAETLAARAEVRSEALEGEIARAESMVLRQEQRAETAERSAARAEARLEALLAQAAKDA